MAHASLERQLVAAQTAKVDLETKLREKDLLVERLERDRRWLAEREEKEREDKEKERVEHETARVCPSSASGGDNLICCRPTSRTSYDLRGPSFVKRAIKTSSYKRNTPLYPEARATPPTPNKPNFLPSRARSPSSNKNSAKPGPSQTHVRASSPHFKTSWTDSARPTSV